MNEAQHEDYAGNPITVGSRVVYVGGNTHYKYLCEGIVREIRQAKAPTSPRYGVIKYGSGVRLKIEVDRAGSAIRQKRIDARIAGESPPYWHAMQHVTIDSNRVRVIPA